ncbi:MULTISPECIES: NAD(P)/FAD-dependent oxidoreductase [unclassified Pseudonocardia]|mgnify:CR=1 FL=1|uniref:flavin-containing monooxygenase n=1 Tax=unclassified Pseudonocardia TaxID=2619320 RepID=UPI000967E82E|nr:MULTISPECIES: NAD(P)/FAD-dependent oxidoreductase [unclassified Pseudonocardia]MBN9098712.1 NAD(P)/FAD-dependent oxidoreductase [Pseudonocardia sp.]OJY51973.1 MAG: cyclopentanone 1,2-monooxygenase [Pseudonocardia sp. 73-21]
MSTSDSTVEELDVLVIGSGFAGIYQLHRLRNLGHSVKIFEAGSALGGIWYWNCYPGARVDTEGPIYQFAYQDLWKDWEYQALYPDWSEVREYFDYVDRKLDISRDVRFNTRVESAEFDTERNQWVVRSSDGATTRCTYLVPCLGFASKPYVPTIPGLDSYRGISHHTGLWPQDGVDLTGKRVAVIGTGASGVQVIQEAASDAADVTVFQRTPNLAIPMGQRTLTPADQAAIKAELPERFASRASTFAGFDYDFTPINAVDLPEQERTAGYEELWEKGGFRFWLATFQDTLFDQKSNDYAYTFWRDKVRARIKDPLLAEKLAPTDPIHPFGVKRPSLEQNYYDVYNQDNLHLVDLNETPIETVTERGIRTADGTEREFDVIVLATGFDSVSGGLTRLDIRGTDGTLLRDKWADGISAHLGVATAGFPNLLFVYGPQSPSGFCNGPTCAEIQGEMIVEIVEHLLCNGHQRIESTPEADQAWSEHVAELVGPTLFTKAKSWYMGANIPGKAIQSLNYPGGLPLYQEKYAESKANGYAGFRIS